jgi:hypothetical protein
MQKQHHRRLAGVALASGLLALAPAASAASHVTVRVEGKGGTLVKQVQVTTSKHRTVGLDGQPTCSGLSALSALDAATGGRWSGPYFDGLGYSPDTINGKKVNTNTSYFSFWFNRHYAQKGLCDTRPKSGDEILLFTDPFTEPKGGLLPLGLRAPGRATAGKAFRVRVVQYSQKGTPTAVKGATVRGGGLARRTNAKGYATFRFRKGREVALRASKVNRIRSEYETVDVR